MATITRSDMAAAVALLRAYPSPGAALVDTTLIAQWHRRRVALLAKIEDGALPPVEADTMPSLRDGDWVFVSAPDAPRDEIRQVVRGEIHSREWCYQPADVQEIRRDPLWRRSSPQEAPR